jgi:alpha-tubulin suppressor-like RCC1 family protein
VLVRGLDDAVEISAGASHACARRANGTVVCWGLNRYGSLGNGGDVPSATPVPVAGLTDVVEISVGAWHSCARRGDGSVMCWGANDSGQIGDGTMNRALVPVPVAGVTDAVEISARGLYFACARRATGAVVCWGSALDGELGDGAAIAPPGAVIPTQPIPVTVVGLADAAEIATGSAHACARRVDGSVVCWGANDAAQLGDGTMTARSTAMPVAGLTDVVELSAGTNITCARRAGGEVSCWGNVVSIAPPGVYPNPSTVPLVVGGLTNAQSISASDQICAVRTDESVVCWGDNFFGQLGDLTTMNATTPVAVVGF